MQNTTNGDLRKSIEQYLTALGFAGKRTNFMLDTRPNLLLLAVDERHSLDFYGLIAFSPGEDRIRQLIEKLREDNRAWDDEVKKFTLSNRELDVGPGTVYDPTTVDWEVLVFYPQDFLADGQTYFALPMSNRSLRSPQSPLPSMIQLLLTGKFSFSIRKIFSPMDKLISHCPCQTGVCDHLNHLYLSAIRRTIGFSTQSSVSMTRMRIPRILLAWAATACRSLSRYRIIAYRQNRCPSLP
ncbi:hypothetical protein K435DRAFT_393361 [Dendrothele bispora CBS 962.96]|uniref:Uncharacterized protein n=1 Tax=Dendrothele bispora (strain CBS 962.96) TaxID=1314807 RepID=A0A4S8L948_DENBC|nr:hypothetical protein K435DRAFT_393361 [Dendrothele bispora CBS 962.96]